VQFVQRKHSLWKGLFLYVIPLVVMTPRAKVGR
jgi:hypothetical protein